MCFQLTFSRGLMWLVLRKYVFGEIRRKIKLAIKPKGSGMGKYEEDRQLR